MNKQFEQLKEWTDVMKAYNSPVPTYDIPAKIYGMRVDTLQEELDEYSVAVLKKDTVAVADALCDMMYFLIGTVYAHGLENVFEKCFDEVHRSNMSKRQPDGTIKYREDGKVLKPDSYSPPDLFSIIYPNGGTDEGV